MCEAFSTCGRSATLGCIVLPKLKPQAITYRSSGTKQRKFKMRKRRAIEESAFQHPAAGDGASRNTVACDLPLHD